MRMDELEDAKETPEEMASNFTCVMFETPQNVLRGARHMARSWSLEGSVKLKNLFGIGDFWDGSLIYGSDQMSEVSAGVSLPGFNGLVTPVMARVSLLSQDWLKFSSSYKEQSLGLSLGLISSTNHDVAYNLS